MFKTFNVVRKSVSLLACFVLVVCVGNVNTKLYSEVLRKR